ncbi:MAG: hypothetical protein ACSHX4_02670 [Opitutaceae bacterium]
MTNAPIWLSLTSGILLVTIYLGAVTGMYSYLRKLRWPIAPAIATAVPLTQAAFSLIFQIRFLSGNSIAGIVLSLCFLIFCGRMIAVHQAALREDTARIYQFAKTYAWVAIPIVICLLYTLLQVLLLPIKNHDALAYHLPRVFLFIQENSFFIDAFNRYHEVIFPVGADILFYPFVALGTNHGLAIFSLSSYIAIGAAAYAISRQFASVKNAITAAVILTSLTALVLQAVTVKNDILMVATAAAALLLVIRFPRESSHRTLLLLLGLCLFGISIKTTFMAFMPGLGLLAILHFKLYQPSECIRILTGLGKDYKLCLVCAIPFLIASQIWLFVWNANQYGTWSGPNEFTERHTQHDGMLGTLANGTRYALQVIQVGTITDYIAPQVLGQSRYSETLNHFYQQNLEPIFEDAGASRESFSISWVTHEDWAWFGPFGAFILFLCIPYAIYRHPKTFFLLLPAMGFYLIVSAKVSWMPWNGRFFSTFFIATIPALAITLESWNRRYIRHAFCALSILFLVTVKCIDFSRPLIPIGRELYKSENRTPIESLKKALTTEQNAWSKAMDRPELHKGEPSKLLADLPASSEVAIFLHGHDQHYGFFKARPDVTWYPLNHIRGVETLDIQKAVDTFMRSEIDYLLLIGIYAESLDPLLVAKSEDTTAHLITNPRLRATTSTASQPQTDQSQ